MSLEQSSINRVFLNQGLINVRCQQEELMFLVKNRKCKCLHGQWDRAMCSIKADFEGAGLGQEGFIGS